MPTISNQAKLSEHDEVLVRELEDQIAQLRERLKALPMEYRTNRQFTQNGKRKRGEWHFPSF
jgi:hypothetical protein